MNSNLIYPARVLLHICGVLFFAAQATAQFATSLTERTVKGKLYVSVDDRATFFVNGTNVYTANGGESRSPEIELKTGDRLVIQLVDFGGDRHFIALFASTDGSTILSFRAHDFKIVPDLDVVDFTPEQLKQWNKYGKLDRGKPSLPIKSSSESIWGDTKSSIIAGFITPQMFSQRQGAGNPGIARGTPAMVSATPQHGPQPLQALTSPQLVIVSATYGAPAKNLVIDVSDEIRSALAGGSPTKKLRDSQEGGTGGVDPAPFVTKVTTITFKIGGVEKKKSFPEGHVLNFKDDLQ
jgi:hypothetical protein